jgi:hypothetical protein
MRMKQVQDVYLMLVSIYSGHVKFCVMLFLNKFIIPDMITRAAGISNQA